MPLPHLGPAEWIIAALAALSVGFAKSGFAGAGLVTVLLMAQIMPARESTGALLPLLIAGDLFAVLVFHKHAQWHHIWRMIPPALAGIIAGFLVMDKIPAGWFAPVIGWIVLVLVVLQCLRRIQPARFESVPHHPAVAWLIGCWSGFTTMIANAAGPIMTLYFLSVRLPKFEFAGTSVWFFLMVNLFKVPFSVTLGLIHPGSLALDLMLVPLVGAGIYCGRILIEKISQKMFERFLLAFAGIAALKLIFF
jgi:uncharacterized protein